MPELEMPELEMPELETPGTSSRRRPAGPEQAVPRDAYCLLKREVERAGCFAPTPWRHLGDAVFVLAAYVTGFVALLGDATFTGREEMPDGVAVYHFETPDGQSVALAYTTAADATFRPGFQWKETLDATGQKRSSSPDAVRLSGSPLYLVDVTKG